MDFDARLLERIKRGDEKAFEQLYRSSYELLCRFAMTLTHSQWMAEEIVDDIFFQLWDNREQLEISALRPYLLRAIRNNSLHAMETPYYVHHADADLEHEMRRLNDYISDGDHPIGWMIERETEQQLRAAVEKLPEQCRRVFCMSRFEGKKYTEIASELGISLNTVKYHIKHALRLLAKDIAPYMLLLLLAAK